MEYIDRIFIPLESKNELVKEFEFKIGDSFFKEYPNSPVEKGEFLLKMFMEIRPDGYSFFFQIEGNMNGPCDRCLAEISIPIQTDNTLLVKLSDEEKREDEIWYVYRDTNEIDLSDYVYENICLAIPIQKLIDCEENSELCDTELLDRLEAKDNSEDEDNPWTALSGLNLGE